MKPQRDFILKVPATNRGRAFIDDLKGYLNTNTYKLKRLRYCGKRVTGFGGHTRMDDANAIRIYVADKRPSIATDTLTLIDEVEHFRCRAEAAEEKLRLIESKYATLKIDMKKIQLSLRDTSKIVWATLEAK